MPQFVAAGLVAGGVSSSAAGILSNVIWAGAMFGLSMVFAPDVPKPEAGKIKFKQSIPPRIKIIGRRRTAGARVLFYSLDGNTAYVIQALCHGESVNPFVQEFFHDNTISVTGAYVDSLGAGQYGDDKIRIYRRFGANPETAYAVAVTDLGPTSVNIWTNLHRGDFTTSALIVSADAGTDNQSKRFPFGLPSYSAVIDSTKVFDPRDVTQDPLDMSTWSFANNENPILQAVTIITTPIADGGWGLDMDECFVPVLAQISAQADICTDGAYYIPLKGGGSEPRYESHSLYTFDTNPLDALAATLGAGDCFIAENGDGTFNLKAGLFDDSDFDVEFLDGDILQLDLKIGREDENDITGVKIKYTSKICDYVEVDSSVYPLTAFPGGDDRRIRPAEAINCISGTQAQRLAKRLYLYESAKITGTMVTRPYGIVALNRRGAALKTSDHPLLNDCKIRLLRREVDFSSGTVTFDFQLIDTVVIDAWDPATEEGPVQQPVNDPVNSVSFSTPTILSGAPFTAGGVTNVSLMFNPGSMAGDNTNYRMRYRVQDVGDGTPGAWSPIQIFDASVVERPSPDDWVVSVSGLLSDILEFELLAFQHDQSQWSSPFAVDTTALAPKRPTSFVSSIVGADVHLNWNNPTGAIFDHARVYRALASQDFTFATDISGPIGTWGAGAAAHYYDVAPASNTYHYWVSAEDVGNVSSIPRGPLTVTI